MQQQGNSCGGDLVFGFLPSAVLQSINELGNWKTRSSAIEQVQRSLAHLGPGEAAVLRQQLPQFVAFVLQLLGDHNFKVVIAGLDVLADTASSLGSALQQHIGELSPVLVLKLLDHRPSVSAAAVKAATCVMQHAHKANPAVLANKLLQQHQQQQADTGPAAGQQDTSGLLEVLILAMLKGPVSSLDLPAAATLLLRSMQRTISTSPAGTKQHALAMEAFALATDSLGAQLPALLKQAGGTDLQVTLVLTQVQQLQRPSLAADGSSIQHNSATQAAIASAEAASMPASGSSFRLGAGLYDRANNSSASSLNSESGMGLSSYTSSAMGSSGGGSGGGGYKGNVEGLAAAEAWAGEQQHPQMLPPGSLGALAAHARLISNASSSIAAAAAAAAAGCGSGGAGARPVSGQQQGGQEGRYGSKLQMSLSSSSLGAEQPPHHRSNLGSPRAQTGASASLNSSSNNTFSHSHLQLAAGDCSSQGAAVRSSGGSMAQQQQQQEQQQLHTQLSKLQLYDSGRYTPNRQDSQLQQDAAAALTANRMQHQQQPQHQAGPSSSEWVGSSSAVGQQQTGLGSLNPALFNVPAGPNLRYQQQSGGGSSRCSSGGGASAGHRSTADQSSRRPTTEYVSHSSGAAAVLPGGSGSSSSWLSAAGPGWAAADGAGGDAASGAYSPGRAETLSPSRDERLALLKRRQVEKRAVSATGSTRGSTPCDSQEGALGPSPAPAAGAAPSGSGDGAGGPRAATAGPAAAGALGWRLSRSIEPPGSGSGSGTGYGLQQAGYGLSSSPAPGEDGSRGSSSGRGGALLQWHIPTGPGGRVLPPGSAPAAATQQQQWQQQQRQYSSSPEPHGSAPRSPGAYSPTTSWDNNNSSSNSSGLASGRAIKSSAGSGTATGSPHSTGQLLQNVPRTVSAAAVLVNAGSDGYSATSSSSSSGNADSSGPKGSSSSTGYRSSRFLQVRSGSSSPAPPGGDNSTSQGAGLLSLGSSRLHGAAGTASSNSSSMSFGRQGQPSQQQQQGLVATRAQTAAPAVGGVQTGPGDWGTTAAGGSSSSPVGGRLASACGPNGSGCFGSGAGGLTSGAGSPTRSPGGLGGRVNQPSGGLRGLSTGVGERPQSSGVNEAELAGADLAPLHDPEASLRQAVAKLQKANTATRMEIDWQGQLDALIDARRLLAHHPEVLRPSARELVLAALPGVDELRSTTSRMALLFFQELPASGLSIERELDEVVPVLLKKAGDLSTAGRDNFLAQEAAKALSLICGAVSEAKALSALIAAGAGHKSPHVRSRTAAHLDEVAAGGAGLEALLRSGNWAVLDRLFKTAAGFLQEGSLDARTYGKRLLWAVKAVLRGNRPDMDRLISGITPEGVQRRVVEVLEGLSAPPPPPANRASSSAGPRLAPRTGQSSGPSTPTSGIPPAPPFSAPPAAMFAGAGQQAYGSGGSTSGGSSSGSGAARRTLFNSGSGNVSAGLAVQGAAAGAGSPGSPTLSGGSSRRRSAATALAGSGRGGPVSPAASGSWSPAAGGGGSHVGGTGAFGGIGSVSGSDRRLSGAACPAGPPGPMSPELQEAVEQVGLQLCSKDWRNRMDALRALQALSPALPEVPNAALEGLLLALVGRLADGNSKVNQKALEVLCEVVHAINLRTLLVMSSLMPALTANLGSTNDKLRACASSALDVVAAALVPAPQLLLQGCAQAVANGSVRTKVAVIEKLAVMLPALHQAQPQLTRLLLPAAFSLAPEARGEAKAAASQLLSLLVALLGSPAVLNAAANVSSATEQRVRELVFCGAARS